MVYCIIIRFLIVNSGGSLDKLNFCAVASQELVQNTISMKGSVNGQKVKYNIHKIIRSRNIMTKNEREITLKKANRHRIALNNHKVTKKRHDMTTNDVMASFVVIFCWFQSGFFIQEHKFSHDHYSFSSMATWC